MGGQIIFMLLPHCSWYRRWPDQFENFSNFNIGCYQKVETSARNNNNIGSEKPWEVHKKNLFQGPLSGALWHFNKTFAKFAHSLALKLIQLFTKRKYNYQVRNNNYWGRSPALQKWAIFNLMSRWRDTLAMFSTDSTASFDVNTRRGFCTEGVIFKCFCGLKRHFHPQPVCATVPNRLPQGGLNFIDKGFFCQHHHCSQVFPARRRFCAPRRGEEGCYRL